MIKFLLFFGVGLVLLLPVLLAVTSAIIYGLWRAFTYETRFRKFFSKYGNEEIARMVASGKIWTGQTDDQLRDALGAPSQIELVQGQEIWIYRGKSALNPAGRRIRLGDHRVQDWS